MKKILLTGFDPVKGVGDTANPSFEVVEAFPDTFMGAEVIKLKLPTAFNGSRKKLMEAGLQHRPDIAFSLGLSPSRPNITLERVAINMRDAGDMDDNDGDRPVDEPIFEDGDPAYFTNLPVRGILKKAKEEGVPMFLSYTAGTYCCNQAMYNLLYHAAKEVPKMLAGFLHIPYFPAQVVDRIKFGSIAKSLSLRAVEICLELALAAHSES